MGDVISFGTELKDGFKTVDSFLSNGNKWLDDFQSFYRDRAMIEREYSEKLSALVKKHLEKKAKITASVSVGDKPTMTPGSLESASMTTWTTILDDTQAIAKDKMTLADQMNLQVAEQVRSLQLRAEGIRERQIEFNKKLGDERDKIYNEVKKSKSKYDDTCKAVEASRRKDDSGKSHKYEKYMIAMNNAKNNYILDIRIANNHKAKYYHQDIPVLLDNMQDVSEMRVRRMNEICSRAVQIEQASIDRCKGVLGHTLQEINRNTPSLDSVMFVKHNLGSWSEPVEFLFEPSPIWHDDQEMITDETSKTYLRNKVKSHQQELQQLKASVASTGQEIEKLRGRRDQSGANLEDISNQLLTSLMAISLTDNSRLTIETQLLAVNENLGDIFQGAKPHNFKQKTFATPVTCSVCQKSIWGISNRGFRCRDCGYSCHAKCQMNASLDCTGINEKKIEKERRKKDKGADDSTLASDDHGYAFDRASTISSVPESSYDNVTSSPVSHIYVADTNGGPTSQSSLNSEAWGTGSILYNFQSAEDGELPVSAGDSVIVLEPDDGSGWIKVRRGQDEGLVPASYANVQKGGASAGGKKRGPAVAPRRGKRD